MVSPTAATFYFYKSFWSVLRNQALETLWTCWNLTWPCTKEEPSPEPCCTWPGSAPKPPRPSPEPSPKPCWTDLALHQRFPKPSPGPSQQPSPGPVEPDLALHQGFLRASPEPSPEPCWTWPVSAKKNQTFSGTFGTFSGTSLNLTRCLHQCTPELFWAEDPKTFGFHGTFKNSAYTTVETVEIYFDPQDLPRYGDASWRSCQSDVLPCRLGSWQKNNGNDAQIGGENGGAKGCSATLLHQV